MLLELSRVTRALVTLLREAIEVTSSATPTVSPLPPDQAPAGSLGVFLYHAVEAAHLKNQAPVGGDAPPVRFTPMGLSLYYQITAKPSDDNTETSEFALYDAQDLIGYAAKALHEYPMVDDTTQIGANPPVLRDVGLDGDGNRLRIALQPMPFDEATNYWAAGSTNPRLALYYEVSVILLQPPKPATVTGRVLSFGVDAFVRGAPFVDGSENVLPVAVPGKPPQNLTARPAQVPIGPVVPPGGGAPQPSVVTFTGYNLVGDTSTTVLLRGGSLTGTVPVDPGWGVAAAPNRVTMAVLATAAGQTVLPGTYAALVQTATRITRPDGSTDAIVVSSNETPFSITPRIDTVAVDTSPVRQLTVTGYPFADTRLAPSDLGVYLGGARLGEVTAAGAVPAGAYRRDSATQMTIGVAPSGPAPMPLRINVLGTQSPPRWVVVA
jgi:hypothetical protein|nr:Pvc16 family protein [Kofleriaceae bacterium]